ncbi:hypothetical protein [Nocardioides alcanivorans]|uniref:hypothetical protein n=1 Tax=Nocardioides alcanivorans TaxID=2897352 RepID=UPI001F3C04EC|nr:hypothetical protein [Nocardioides alcanivorans]
MLILGVAAPSDDEIDAVGGNVVVRSWSSPRPGTTLLSGVPQGLFFEDSDGSYVSGVVDQRDVEMGDWPAAEGKKGDSFQRLVDELAKGVRE